MLDFDNLFCCWCHVAFRISHVVVLFVFCLLPRAALHDSCLSYCVFACESRLHRLRYLSYRSIRLLWRYSQTADHLICFGRGLFPPTRLGFMPSPRLADCPLLMHRGQPALGRHRPVSILVETSGCCCKGSRDSSASESVCLRRGGHPAERAESGVWVGTPGPVDLSSPRWAPPYISRPRQLSQRGRTVPRAEEISHIGFFLLGIY